MSFFKEKCYFHNHKFQNLDKDHMGISTRKLRTRVSTSQYSYQLVHKELKSIGPDLQSLDKDKMGQKWFLYLSAALDTF